MRTKHLIMAGIMLASSVSTVSAGSLAEWYQRTYKKETKMGVAFQAAKSNQILNPDAGKEPEPVQGLDGQAAESAMDAYRGSFGRTPSKADYPVARTGLGGK